MGFVVVSLSLGNPVFPLAHRDDGAGQTAGALSLLKSPNGCIDCSHENFSFISYLRFETAEVQHFHVKTRSSSRSFTAALEIHAPTVLG